MMIPPNMMPLGSRPPMGAIPPALMARQGQAPMQGMQPRPMPMMPQQQPMAPRPMMAFGGMAMHHPKAPAHPSMFGASANPLSSGMHRLGMGNPLSMRPHFAPGGMPMPQGPMQGAPGGMGQDPRMIQAVLALARQRALQARQAPPQQQQRPPQTQRAPNGDPIHTGALNAPVAGRTDHIPVTVPTGSYVIPADVVNHYGQDNSEAGHKVMEQLFRSGAIKKIHAQPGVKPYGGHLPIAAAGGEYIVAPEAVAHLAQPAHGGMGHNRSPDDEKRRLKIGHEILDHFVKMSRAEHIKTLKKLPGPQK